MHIVHTEASCGWGGQEIRILEESRGLTKRGHSVEIICAKHSRIYEVAQDYCIPTIPLPIEKKSLSGLLAVYRWLKNNPVDIVNTHSSTDSWLTGVACKFLSNPPPIVRTRHISSPIPNNFASRWLYTSSTSHIVTTGEALREQVIRETGASPSMITSIPTGIDPARFTPEEKGTIRKELSLDPNLSYIGIVATLRSWKGHLYLLEAFKKADLPEWKLLIVGDGPIREPIQEKIETLALSDRVILAGQQQNPEKWLQALDIFCLPSYANEGVPQAILQAMFTALPIITTPVGAIQEAVTDQKSALIVPPQDSEAIADALRTLSESKPLRQQLGSVTRAFALANFSLDTMLERMERVFSNSTRKTAQ